MIETAQSAVMPPSAVLRWLGRAPYESTWRSMQQFTEARGPHTPDELWFLEHPPVFTLGMNAKPEHLLAPGDIPVVQIDRGGQVTYHGPGQLVVYPLLDLRRLGIGIRQMVVALEDAIVGLCRQRGVHAAGNRSAPGIYVDGRKLASIGLRVRRGCSYHGLALNVTMDLEPFQRINPCGFAGLQVTDMDRLGIASELSEVAKALAPMLLAELRLPSQAVWMSSSKNEDRK